MRGLLYIREPNMSVQRWSLRSHWLSNPFHILYGFPNCEPEPQAVESPSEIRHKGRADLWQHGRAGGGGLLQRAGLDRVLPVQVVYPGGSTCVPGLGTEGGGHLLIMDFLNLVPIRVAPARNCHRMTGDLSHGKELPNAFLDRSRWLDPLPESILQGG
jgi:hypothetical protein